MKVKKLWNEVVKFHNEGAYHIKRGFSLKDSHPITASNHLIEEVTELQAEVTTCYVDNGASYDYNKAVEEAADVLLVFLHLLKVSKINPRHVLRFAWKKLHKNFTLDKSKIKTKTPGFNRSNRLSDESLESVKKGIEQAKRGKLISEEEVTYKPG